MGPIGTYQLFATGGPAVGGMMTRMDKAIPPSWLYYFMVAEINAAVTRIQAAGGTVLNGPHQVPGGSWIVQALDPQGALFAVVAPGS
jgi:predicted enzyme related to lactoylglutathione lyase